MNDAATTEPDEATLTEWLVVNDFIYDDNVDEWYYGDEYAAGLRGVRVAPGQPVIRYRPEPIEPLMVYMDRAV